MKTNRANFVDYYEVLQVHHDAEPEIIKTAYRRLAQMHHPDLNAQNTSTEKMQMINQAYQTVSNPALRKSYHRSWVRFQGTKTRHARQVKRQTDAQRVLDAYFRCLLDEKWKNAYSYLSRKDSGTFTIGEFCEWKQAVKALYQMGAYVIKPFRSYDRCVIGDTEYDKVHVFSVFLTDRDHRTGKVSEETYTKYVVWDGDEWRVCLGYSQLKPIILKLKYLAAQAPMMDPERVFNDVLLKHDKLTGFLSRRGLMERIDKEQQRARRHKNPFSLAVISVDPVGGIGGVSDMEYKNMCLLDAATQLKASIRAIDDIARIGENRFGVLLIETNESAAKKALRRLVGVIRQREGLQYRIDGSAVPYRGESAEDTLLYAEHDARMRVITGKDNVKRYYIKLDEQQV